MSHPPRNGPDGEHDDGGRARPGVERVGAHGTPTAVRIVALLLVVLVGLAVLKPWEALAGPSTEQPERSPGALASPAPTPAVTPAPVPSAASLRWDGLEYFHCLGYPEWLLVSDEVQTDGLRRTWTTAGVRTGALAPGDPGIPRARIGAPSVPAIGVCVPGATSIPEASADAASGDTSLVVWEALDGTWREVTTRPVAGGFGAAGGVLVVPDPRDPAADATGGWSRGRYVLEVRKDDGSPTAWLGIDVAGPRADGSGTDAPGGGGGTPGPGASRAPAPSTAPPSPAAP